MFDSGSIAGWRATLSCALAHGEATGLDDTEVVAAIRELEDLGRTITAAQARLALELDRSQARPSLPDGVRISADEHRARESRHAQSVGAQVAWARRESPHRGRQRLSLARIASRELPHSWRAWREGRTSERRVSLVARETACLDLDDRLRIDAWLAEGADRFERMGDRALAGAVAAEASRLDPASVVLRRRHAEADRQVTLRPAPDTMTWLCALLPVKEGVRAYAALSRAADSARATGDPRTRGQVMADALVRGVAAAAPDAGVSSAPFELALVMTDRALFTGDDEPGHLDGYGPIPAELAREIVAGVLDDGTEVAIRRLYADPETGRLAAMDSVARCFRGNLAHFVRLRDRTCRTPWCDAPIRHVDHAHDHATGGPTTAANGQGLCEACTHAEQEPGWRARPGPDGAVETTMPSGQTYLTQPPRVASIRRTPLRVDYVLAG